MVKHGTWTFVARRTDMHVLPFTCVFRLKPFNAAGTQFLEKARCCARGDLQAPEVDFDPHTVHAPVASHEAIRLLLAVSAADSFIVEGGDVVNAYQYGNIDYTVYMEQPTDSSGVPLHPSMVCKLEKSMYGLRQAGEIWGSLLVETLEQWDFQPPAVNPLVMFKSRGQEFVSLIIFVYELPFASNSSSMIASFKQMPASTFDVKLFGEVTSFLGWDIKRTEDGINISQQRYAKEIVTKNGLQDCNGTNTPMAMNVDLRPAQPEEKALAQKQNAVYRRQVGELLYLAVCTRPDIMLASLFASSKSTRSDYSSSEDGSVNPPLHLHHAQLRNHVSNLRSNQGHDNIQRF